MNEAADSTNTETAAVAEQGADVAPEPASSTKDAVSKKNAPKAKKRAKAAKKEAPAKEAKPAGKKASKAEKPKKAAKPVAKKEAKPASKKASRDADKPKEPNKKDIVLGLLQAKCGATLAEIMKATGWQAHSVRGFISGTLGKKMGISVESFKNATDERAYRSK